MNEHTDSESDLKTNAYHELLTERGLTRHLERQQIAQRKVSYQEELDSLTQQLETLGIGISRIIEDPLSSLREKISSLHEEISQLIPEAERKEIISQSWSRLRAFMRERRKMLQALEMFKKKEINLSESLAGKSESEKQVLIEIRKAYRESASEVEERLRKQVLENPESFLAHVLLTIRSYKKQIPSGIVETDYPLAIKEKAIKTLTENRLVAFLGETGTGKTRLAEKIAKELSGEYIFIPGHRFISREDLFSYLGIDVERVSPEDVPEFIERAKKRLLEEEIETPYQKNILRRLKKRIIDWYERNKKSQLIEEIVKGQAKQPQLITKIFITGVLKAAQEGKIVIIDEFNYIPPALLAGLNALIEATPGREISIFGQAIRVKSGFGVILTGNMSRSEFTGRYLERQPLDPALVNRLNSGLIEYHSLPQDTDRSFLDSILTEEDFRKGNKTPERELFQIGLSFLADEKGNISGPKNLLEKLWDLSREFSLLQKIYAGEQISHSFKLDGDRDVILKNYPISNRTFLSIINAWRNDGYRYSLDWYIYDNLIRPASLISPSEAGQMFILLQKRTGFFQGKEWDLITVNPINFKISGIDSIERQRENFLKTQEVKEPRHYFTPKEIAEAFMGVKMPRLITTEKEQQALLTEEQINFYLRTNGEFQDIKKLMLNWEETIRIFCEDESAILKF